MVSPAWELEGKERSAVGPPFHYLDHRLANKSREFSGGRQGSLFTNRLSLGLIGIRDVYPGPNGTEVSGGGKRRIPLTNL